MADRITSAGYAAAAIDGLYHGERVPSPLPTADYQALIAAEGIGRAMDRLAGDWALTRDLLVDAGLADPASIAYFGLSMATRFGLATAVALGPGLRCAVFGKFGTQATADTHPGLHDPDRALRDAARITAPVLFHMQWNDEMFPRTGQLELFDAFPGHAKELVGFAGGHRSTPDHAVSAWIAFIGRHLA